MDIVIRATIAFLFILLLTRITGRRNLAQYGPFDLIMLVLIGDLVQQGITQSDYSVTGILLAAGTIGVLSFLVSELAYRVERVRPVIEGEPIVIIKDGKLLEENLQREHITVQELASQARLQQIGTLGDVAWAILERTGQISFIPKKQ
jgi:uncharacterized membrane protein YcaP (DUF421 family)